MGRAKEKHLEEQQEQFISGKNLVVCERHFDDQDILGFIRKNGDSNLECSFCEETDFDDEIGIVNKITWDDLLDRIVPCIHHFYDDPANGLMYDSSEGGYLGNTYNSLELLRDVIGIEADDEVIEEIADSISQEIWTEAEFYGDTYTGHLNYTWEVFSKLVKYEVRYVFNEIEIKSDNYDGVSQKPFLILKDIGRFISELNLVKTLPEKSNLFNQEMFLYRARQHKETDIVCTCGDIGPAPNKFAGANRFSAEGISIFYGAEDEDTAIKEVINSDKKDECISIGKFYPRQELNLIDLRQISSAGFFNENINLIEPSRFLKKFVENISKKIEKDGNERIEYIPSQIVTEYFRHVLPYFLGKEIHGIIYKSAQNIGKDCYAIFADRFKCKDEDNKSDDTLLILANDSIKKIKISEVK